MRILADVVLGETKQQFLFGIGLVYPLHRGAVMFNCEYNWTQTNPPLYLGTSDDAILFRRLSLSIGYQFGYGTKR